jgi:hypothetical protein
MIRVRINDSADAGDGPAGTSPVAADDWRTLDELAQAALLLAHRLRTQNQEADVRDAGDGGDRAGAAAQATGAAVDDRGGARCDESG